MKPLFVPLKTQYFREFECGDKTVEYRRYGPRWNEQTCLIGRRVTLSHGYSGARLTGTIVSFEQIFADDISSTIYPADEILAAISIRLDGPASRRMENRSSTFPNLPVAPALDF